MRNRRGAGGEGRGAAGHGRHCAGTGVRVLGGAAAAPSPLPAAPPAPDGAAAPRPRGGAAFAARGPPRSAHLRARGFSPWIAAFPFLCSSNLFLISLVFRRLERLAAPRRAGGGLRPPACALPRLHLTGGAARESRSCAPGGVFVPGAAARPAPAPAAAPAAVANGGAGPCPEPRGALRERRDRALSF